MLRQSSKTRNKIKQTDEASSVFVFSRYFLFTKHAFCVIIRDKQKMKGVFMNQIAFLFGIGAVLFYILGYLQKKRIAIIVMNIISRLLGITQYIMLGAFEGAILDIAAIISSYLAEKKKIPFVRKHPKWFVLGVSLMIVGAGAVTYKNIYSLLPVIGVLIQTGAFWHDDEKKIRIMSFFGAPFWLAYNFISGAYPSCVGEFLSMVSVAVAFI